MEFIWNIGLLLGIALTLRLALGAKRFHRLVPPPSGTEATVFGAVARFGGRERRSLNSQVMRSTLGIRIATLGLSAVLLSMIATAPEQMPELGIDAASRPLVLIGTGLLLAWSLLYVFGTEVSWDNHSVILRRPLMRRQELLWRDLASVADRKGQHVVHLYRRDGSAIEVLRFLGGFDQLMAQVHRTIAQNEATGAGASRSRNR